ACSFFDARTNALRLLSGLSVSAIVLASQYCLHRTTEVVRVFCGMWESEATRKAPPRRRGSRKGHRRASGPRPSIASTLLGGPRQSRPVTQKTLIRRRRSADFVSMPFAE